MSHLNSDYGLIDFNSSRLLLYWDILKNLRKKRKQEKEEYLFFSFILKIFS